MSDLIDRDAAIEAMKNMYHAAEKWREEASDDVIKARAESCMASLIEMKLRIEKLPSVQPERKKGRWIPQEDENGDPYGDKCSECGARYVMPEGKTNYCPECGARMEGER